MMSAISRADRVNVPGGGAVETVVTVCTQRRRLLGTFRIKEPQPSLRLPFEFTRPARGSTLHHFLFVENRAHAASRRVSPATLGHVSRIVRASPIVFVRRLPPADMHAPLRGMASWL
jgi:hypothetical protein